MSRNWRTFWRGYRNDDARSEDDLFVQVGKTIDRQPIPRAMFAGMVDAIDRALELQPTDGLLDLCCGNGLLSFALAPRVARVAAVDFAEHLIEAARRFKALPNIAYRVGDVTAPLATLVDDGMRIDKLLMNDALAYFEPDDLDRILGHVIDHVGDRPFAFLLTGIPDAARKWTFYDTPERRARHEANELVPGNTNDGMGRWWTRDDITTACAARGLEVAIADQPPDISHYRMNALIARR